MNLRRPQFTGVGHGRRDHTEIGGRAGRRLPPRQSSLTVGDALEVDPTFIRQRTAVADGQSVQQEPLLRAGRDRVFDGGVDVVDEDLEVQHLRLLVRLLRPRGRLVPGLGLEVQPDPAAGIAGLDPPVSVTGRDVPPEQAAVEVGQPLGVVAVDAHRRPTQLGRHLVIVLRCRSERQERGADSRVVRVVRVVGDPLLDRFRIVRVPESVYQMAWVPFRLQTSDALVVLSLALAICFVATLYPSRGAARLDPAEALRYE